MAFKMMQSPTQRTVTSNAYLSHPLRNSSWFPVVTDPQDDILLKEHGGF